MTDSTNYIRNGTFENGVNDWDGNMLFWGTNPAILTRSSTVSHSGNYSMRVQIDTSGDRNTFLIGQSNVMPAGKIYRYSAWLYIPTGGPDVRVEDIFRYATPYFAKERDKWVYMEGFYGNDVEPNQALCLVAWGEDIPTGSYFYVDDAEVKEMDWGRIIVSGEKKPITNVTAIGGGIKRRVEGAAAIVNNARKTWMPPPEGTVISSFEAPEGQPTGLTWDGTHLWCAGYNENKIYELDPTTGAIISSISASSPYGMAWDGTNLWYVNYSGRRIYKLNPTTGATISSFAPLGIPTGLTWDGTNLWYSDYTNKRIYKVSPSGSVISSFAPPKSSPYGMAWDGTNLWHLDFGEERIYKLNPDDGSVISSFASPGSNPRGLTWDGANLWCADVITNRIYKLGGF